MALSNFDPRLATLRAIRSWRAAGVRQWAEPPQPPPPPTEEPAKSDPGAPASDPAAALQVLENEVRGCTQCGDLARTRTQTVFGVGTPTPELCFFGEAPGFDEDQQGEPFVGKAGQLLNKILGACRLRREDVYILNVLKCRPPGNRNPNPDEISNCRPFFERQLQVLRPRFICCLGAFAARTLLNTEASVGKLRGTLHDYNDAKVMVTYHPAYLLRNEGAKRLTWEDMKMLMRAMGRPLD